MNFFYAIFTFIATALILLFVAFSALILRINTGKSIRNSNYPPVAGTVFGQLFYFNDLYDYQTKVAQKWPTFRLLAPHQSEIYTTEPKNVEHILKTKFEKYSKGKYSQDIVTDLFGQGIFAIDGDKWRQQRKLASFEFSTRVLRDFSCIVFRRNAVRLVKAVSGFSEKSFDVQDLLMRCTLDSMFKVGFGVELNCLEGSSKEGTAFIKAFDDSNEFIYWRYVDPLWKIKRFLNIGYQAALKKNIKVIDDFVHDVIKTKRNKLAVQHDNIDKEDILSRFLVESKKDPVEMNDKYLRDIILNFMIAGKDTSANTLSWFFYMLCKNPLVQDKIVREITDICVNEGNKVSIDDFVEGITDQVLEKMHYLHSALTETLRLYPAVPVDGRCSEIDDVLPDGFKLKKGDDVYYVSYAMGRMQYIWGEDAEDFLPERWLKNGIFQPESPFKFVAFHVRKTLMHNVFRLLTFEEKLLIQVKLQGGPRICLGKDFAYRQMKIVSMALLRFFKFQLADETKTVTYRTMFTLHISGGLHLSAVPRTPI